MNNSLPKQKKLIPISEAAKTLGVSIDTVRRWDKTGILHSTRQGGKNRYFSPNELEKHKTDQPLPISEAATMLGISATTLRRLETRELLKPTRNRAGERVYSKDSLNSFLDSDYFLRKKPVSNQNQPSTEPKKLEIKPRSLKFDFLAISIAVFLLLVTVGIGNIKLTEAGKTQPMPVPAVLGIAISETRNVTTSYIQLGLVILLYPLLILFVYKFLTRRWRRRGEANETTTTTKTINKIDSLGISDIDKRVFLKLIGGAGIFLFFFSLFNKKAEGLFFKSIPGSASGQVTLTDTDGNAINPAQNQPLDGYSITEIDDNTIAYYGFLSKDGAWYIMRADTINGSFRYTKNKTNFSDNWTNRENLKYDYYNYVFRQLP